MLTDIEKKQLARYEQLMTLPAWKYIIVYGVLFWGVGVAVLVSLINLFLDKTSFQHILRKEIWINLIIFPIGGIFFGWYMRQFMPRQIKRLKEKAELK